MASMRFRQVRAPLALLTEGRPGFTFSSRTARGCASFQGGQVDPGVSARGFVEAARIPAVPVAGNSERLATAAAG